MIFIPLFFKLSGPRSPCKVPLNLFHCKLDEDPGHVGIHAWGHKQIISLFHREPRPCSVTIYWVESSLETPDERVKSWDSRQRMQHSSLVEEYENQQQRRIFRLFLVLWRYQWQIQNLRPLLLQNRRNGIILIWNITVVTWNVIAFFESGSPYKQTQVRHYCLRLTHETTL